MTAEHIDPDRREHLRRKYGMDKTPMDPRANMSVQGCVRAEQITKRVWRNLRLADVLLAGVPAMTARANAARVEFHRLAARDAQARALGNPPLLHYETHDGDADFDPNEVHEQGVTRLWTVGTDWVFVVRDRWHDSPNRPDTTVSYTAGMLGLGLDTAVYTDAPCTVNIAENCGGETRKLPVDQGTLLLLFRCCWPCEAALTAALPHPPNTPGSP